MTSGQKAFIERIAPLIQKYAPQYDIRVHSPIIAQAILESGWGKSKLAAVYHNYFGLKCGSKWQGASVNMATQEEYKAGVKTSIRANFRVYDSMEEGIKGYFEFIKLPRYDKLKGVTSPETYLKRIKNAGYATASDYVEDVLKVVDTYGLRKYDTKTAPVAVTTPITEKDIVLVGHGSGNPAYHNLYSYTAHRQAQTAPNGKHKGIVAVRRPKALTDDKRAEFRAKIKTIVGRNIYSQEKRGYVYSPYKNGKYYSDCSSSGMATLKAIGLKFGWLYNTAAIYQEDEFATVPVTIKDGHITNPELLKVGDAVLYRGNDPSRPLQIGHVEGVYDTPARDVQVPKTAKAYSGIYPSLSNGREDSNGTGYYKKGDGITTLTNYPTQIRRIQKLGNWIDDSTPDLTEDGEFGKLTETKINVCRRRFGLCANGRFDVDLLYYAKQFRK